MKLKLDEWILERFSKFRELKKLNADLLERARNLQEENIKIKKQPESDKALIDSLNRYIEALEGRDAQREKLISELQGYLAAYRKTIDGLLKRPMDKAKTAEADNDGQGETT